MTPKANIPTKTAITVRSKSSCDNLIISGNHYNIVEVAWVGIPMPVVAVVYIEVPPNLELEMSADISALLDNDAKARIYRRVRMGNPLYHVAYLHTHIIRTKSSQSRVFAD